MSYSRSLAATFAIGVLFLAGCGRSAFEKAGASVSKDKQGKVIAIDFTKMEFSDQTVSDLASDIQGYKGLTSMDFTGTSLSDDGLSTVIDILKGNPDIQTIHIKDTGITDKGADLLLDFVKSERVLINLSVTDTAISAAKKEELKKAQGMYGLVE